MYKTETHLHVAEVSPCSKIKAEEKVEYRKWYSGHRHCDSETDSKRSVVYQNLTPVL